MPRSRSRSPKRDRKGGRSRSRSKERERRREKDRRRSRSRSPRRNRHRSISRSPSPRRYRRSPSPRRRRSRSNSPRRYRGSRSQSAERKQSEDSTHNEKDNTITVTDAEPGEANEEDDAMMKLMGFSNFDSTKGKHVDGCNASAINVKKARKYRQYMNRKGGFNRPLDYVA